MAQKQPPILVRAEVCLSSNVNRIAAVDDDLVSAANFLLTYACAREVSDATQYEFNIAMVKQFSAVGASFGQAQNANDTKLGGRALPSVDPDTGEIIVPARKDGDTPNAFNAMLGNMGSSASQFTGFTVPVSLRKLAGSLVLEALERRRPTAR